jgi:hypothetical protein
MNGAAERCIRTINSTARCLLTTAALPVRFWSYAVLHACLLRNHTPKQKLGWRTPMQLYAPDSKHVNLMLLPAFGQVGYALIPQCNRESKFTMVSQKSLYMGQEDHLHVVYVVDTGLIRRVRTFDFPKQHVTFHHWTNEDITPFCDVADPDYEPEGESEHQNEVQVHDQPQEHQEQGEFNQEQGETTGDQSQTTMLTGDQSENQAMGDQKQGESQSHTEKKHGRLKRKAAIEADSKRAAQDMYIRELDEQIASYVEIGDKASVKELMAMVAETINEISEDCEEISQAKEPENWRIAVKNKQWRMSMQDEVDSLVRRGTWELVDRKHAKRIMRCVWAFKCKRNEKGIITRLKSRLNAAGYSQQKGIDFHSTFAGVGRRSTFRILMSLIARFRLSYRQADFESAFLNGDLDEELYMMQPSGFDDNSGRVCRLKKSIYGLKQAGNIWAGTLKKTLERLGYERSAVDPGLYFTSRAGMPSIIFTYVDDLLMVSLVKGNEELDRLTTMLSKDFPLKANDEVRHFLGIEIVHGKKGIYLGQEAYALKIVEKYAPADLTPRDSLYGIHLDDVAAQGSPLLNDQEHSWYRGAVGAILFLGTSTRPDLGFATSHLGRYVGSPTEAHREMLLEVLAYIKATSSLGLMYEHGVGELEGTLMSHLRIYSDADYAGCKATRRSRSGFMFDLYGTVHWRSKLHSTISLSTMEAELYAAVLTMREAIDMRVLLWEIENMMRFPGEHRVQLQPVIMNVDNQSTIARSLPGENTDSTKHIAFRDLWIQDRVEKGDLKMEYIRSVDNPADLLTKPILGAKLKTHVGMRGITDKYNMKISLDRQPRENVELNRDVYLIELVMQQCV